MAHKKDEFMPITDRPLFLGVLALAAVLVLFNQWQIMQLSSALGGPSVSKGGSSGGGSLALSEGKILAPVLLLPGEEPVLQGYKTRIKELPTISSNEPKDKTGDAVQDAINALVPTGTPPYGQAAGVSFDDPIAAQNTWGNYERSIQLSPEQEQRWQKIVGSFTCDYCCGSPSRPTIITHCGCGHARAWRGMAKWLIVNMGDTITDEQIFGELSRWKTLWYPGPTVKRVLEEQAASGGGTSTLSSVGDLPGMVGGC
jgi:hypothetical protein